MKKTFVHLELMNHAVLVAKEAKARGFHVVACNHDPLRTTGPFAVPDGLVDEYISIESWQRCDDVRAILTEISQRHEVVGTYAVGDFTVVHDAVLRELAGLPNNGEHQLIQVLDKAHVRATLFEQGLSTLRSAPLAEALAWDSWPMRGSAVMKPVNGSGSALCYVVSTMEELRAAAEQASAFDIIDPLTRDFVRSRGDFVVEEKADGELLSVESLVYRGEVHTFGLTGRYLLASNPVVEQGIFHPYRHPRQAEIVAACARFHESMKIVHGATHLEVMVPKEGPIELIDFNVRVAGIAAVVGFGYVYGVPFERLLTDLACGARPDMAALANPRAYAAEMMVLPPPGATEFRELVFPAGARNQRLTKQIGGPLTGRSDQFDVVAMFIVVGDTAARTHRDALDARRSTVFNGAPLGDNPNNILLFSEYLGEELDWSPEESGDPDE